MKNTFDIIIVGAGPVGLYFASKLEELNKDYLLLEAGDEMGGQITRLYPNKDIVDIEGIECIKAKDYISLLISKINKGNVLLNTKVINIVPGDVVELKTTRGTYYCSRLVLATGLGLSSPRPLGVDKEYEVDNIAYKLDDFSALKNKRVAVFGGGDSALDWAKHLSRLSDNVSLIHRRTEFRGNTDTIKDCKNLKVYLPFVPDHLKINNKHADEIVIKEVVPENVEPKYISIPVDLILVNYGNIAEQTNFPFEKDGAFIKVNENHQVTKNIYVIGDVSAYENKKRRIQPGINEADYILKIID